VNEYENEIPSNVVLMRIKKDSCLPFDSDTFDTASILDVIEHVVDQHFILKELNRVLKPGGLVVATVPHKHVFSFLDMGNFKFSYTRLHKWYYVHKYSRKEYQRRYVECANGLFGDIEMEKKRHQHFLREELESLLCSSSFQVVRFDGSGLFIRPLLNVAHFSPEFFKTILQKLVNLDAKFFSHANLFCVATKI
jgi:SAM-dependent methyltransferase